MNKHLGTAMAKKAYLYSFPHTQYRTRAEFAHDGSGDFVIIQAGAHDQDGCDIVLINRQDAINLAHRILDHAREVAA